MRPSARCLGVRDDEVPAVTAIGAAVCDDIAGLEAPIRLGHTQQAAAASAVDAGDLLGHVGVPHIHHDRSVAPPGSIYGDAMRVVGGILGGRKLETPGTGAGSIRPTSDRAREAVFNMLASLQPMDGITVLDLFAGTGALGIEALSRGAARAAFVESDAAACGIIAANLAALDLSQQADIVRSDVESYLARRPDPVDLAFADPPYDFDGWAELLGTLSADVLVCESDSEVEPGPDQPWHTARARRYGTPVITILVRHPEAETRGRSSP